MLKIDWRLASCTRVYVLYYNLIGDQGIHQINFWSFDTYSGETCITKKPLMLANM